MPAKLIFGLLLLAFIIAVTMIVVFLYFRQKEKHKHEREMERMERDEKLFESVETDPIDRELEKEEER